MGVLGQLVVDAVDERPLLGRVEAHLVRRLGRHERVAVDAERKELETVPLDRYSTSRRRAIGRIGRSQSGSAVGRAISTGAALDDDRGDRAGDELRRQRSTSSAGDALGTRASGSSSASADA